jgi:hypothetical protein
MFGLSAAGRGTFHKAINRLTMFQLAQHMLHTVDGAPVAGVSLLLEAPTLPRRHVERLPPSLQKLATEPQQ